MQYLERPASIPDNTSVLIRQYHLKDFFGKLREVAVDYCTFDMAETLPVKIECPDESQGLKIPYFISTFGAAPFVGRSVGAELDRSSVAPAAHHAKNLVFVMGSHTGFDHKTKTLGKLYREKEGGFSPCCGKLGGVIAPYMEEYERAKNSIRIFRKAGKVFLDIPNRLLGIHSSFERHAVKVQLHPSLVKADPLPQIVITEQRPRSVAYEASPGFLGGLEAKKRTISEGPMPIGEDLGPEYFRFQWISPSPFPDDLTRRLHPLMHKIVSSPDYPPMVTIANVNTWIEFNRFVDTIHATPDIVPKGVLGVSGLTVDLYFEDRVYRYSNVYYPQYAFFKPAGEKQGVVMGPDETNKMLDSYETPTQRLSIDEILACNDEAEQAIPIT